MNNSIDPSQTGKKFPHSRRALFVRLDRIGDLVLTLPTDQSGVSAEVDWWIPKGLSFVTDHATPPRSAEEFARTKTFAECVALAKLVRKKNYDLAVVFHAPWWVGFVLWLARIPVRIGVQSQWHSFVFFNRGIRQKRSRAEFSELEYGFRLLEEGLGLAIGSLPRSTLKLTASPAANSAVGASDKSGPPARTVTGLTPGGYVVVHPGMGGSALNWSTDRYAELIHELAREKKIAITGTASDESFLSPLRKKLAADDDLRKRVVWLDGKLNGPQLLSVLGNAYAVVAPSTGVLHLAASLGVPTVGLFSQVRVQRAVRWGPQGPKAAVIEAPPGAEGPESMDHISVEQVVRAIHRLVRN